MAHYYHIDPELRLIHGFRNCSALKVAIKYNYAKEFIVHDIKDAGQLDALAEKENLKVCHTCYRREQGFAKKERRLPRPGFRREPAK